MSGCVTSDVRADVYALLTDTTHSTYAYQAPGSVRSSLRSFSPCRPRNTEISGTHHCTMKRSPSMKGRSTNDFYDLGMLISSTGALFSVFSCKLVHHLLLVSLDFLPKGSQESDWYLFWLVVA